MGRAERNDSRRRIQALEEDVLLERVRALCTAAPRSLRDVAIDLFGAQKGYGRILAYQESGAHMEYLARRGLVEIANLADLEGEGDPVVFYRSAASAR